MRDKAIRLINHYGLPLDHVILDECITATQSTPIADFEWLPVWKGSVACILPTQMLEVTEVHYPSVSVLIPLARLDVRDWADLLAAKVVWRYSWRVL